ncbi:MAG TPA: hypothetical protein VIT91_13660 [Chthoniobacterales bacterium]
MRINRGILAGLFVLAGAIICLPVPALASEKIWGALIVATNEETPTPIPARLDPFSQRLSSVFGYSHFRLLGESTREVDSDVEGWLILGDDFLARSIVVPTEKGAYQLGLEIYFHKKKIADTVVKLGKGSPLFVRGPLYGRGQLILVLMVL